MYPSLKVELRCQAYGVPEPHYTWVDWEGIDATEKETWVLDQISGTLTAFKLERQDAGEYTCIAENSAGRIEAPARLDVIIKPHVQELYNKTIGIGAENVTLTCKASGDPLPKIVWRKWSRNEEYVEGTQRHDPRISVVESGAYNSAIISGGEKACLKIGGGENARVSETTSDTKFEAMFSKIKT